MQTNYSGQMDAAFEGALADSKSHDALSKLAQDAGMKFGIAVKFGSNAQGVQKLTAITEKVAGILIHEHVENGVLNQGMQVALLRKGRIYVMVEENVSVGDPVFVRAVAAGLEVAGAFRKSQDGTDCIDLSAKAQFLSAASAGGLAIVDLNLP